MICKFCKKRIVKGRPGLNKRVRLPKRPGQKLSEFVHAKCYDAWRVRERLKGARPEIYRPILTPDMIDAAVLKARQHGLSTLTFNNAQAAIYNLISQGGQP